MQNDKIKYLLLVVLILNLFNNINSVSVSIFGDSSILFNGYPSSTSGKCDVKIPFIVDSVISILSVNGTSPFSFIPTYIAADKSKYIGTMSSDSVYGLSYKFYFIVNLSNGDNTQFEYIYNCSGYDTNKLNHTILNTSIYYNTLSFMVKFNEYLARPNVTLDLDVPVPFTQRYLGDNIYSISLHYNTPSVLFSPNYSFSILFPTYSYIITVDRPFKYSNIIPVSKYYSSSDTILTDSVYYELSGFGNNYNNYFSTYKNTTNNYFDEPFLISTNKYLSVLSSTNYFALTNYSLSYYYSNSNVLLFNQIVNQISKTLVTPSSATTFENQNLLDFSTSSFKDYNYPLIFKLGEISPEFRYPFGIQAGNTIKGVYMRVPIPIEMYRIDEFSTTLYINDLGYTLTAQKNSNPPTINYPNINDYSIQLLPGGNMHIYLNTSFTSYIGFYSSPTTLYKIFSQFELASDTLTSPIFEVILPRFNLYKIKLISSYNLERDFILGSSYLYYLGYYNQYRNLTSIKDLDILPTNFNYLTSLKNVTFLFNDLVVTNKGVSNKMFISLDSYPTDREVKVSFIYSDYRANEKKDIVYSTYNPTTSQFEFEFNIPKNIKPGNVSYTITLDSLDNINYYSYSLPLEYQLRVSESLNVDLYGPVVTKVQSTNILSGFKAGYTIEITDSANGFKQGYIIVRGSVDMTETNITITPSNLYAGTVLKGLYSIGFDYDTPCISQVFSIVYAYFEDTEGYSTEYDMTKVNKKNPFYLILDSFNPSIVSICDTPLPTTDGSNYNPNIILSIPTSAVFLQTKESRTVAFNYTAYHQDGISSIHRPKVYIPYLNNRYLVSFSTEVLASNSTHTTFSSKVLFPYSPYVYKVSIYGLLSKAGTNGGFTPNYLESIGINTYFTSATSPSIATISSSSKLSSTGLGGLWLYGSYLGSPNTNAATDFQIQYTDEENGGLYNTIIPTIIYQTAVYFPTIKATTKPINVRIFSPKYSVNVSDPYTIYPVIYDFNYSSSNNNTSLCKGSPLCGGPSQGTCISSGCQCILPWTGIDCMSKVIQVTQPEINQTNPSTNITTGEEATINSIISIIGIKELSVNSNEVNKYSFEEWEYKLILNDSYVTRYTYSSYIKKNNIKVSNITVTLDWYKVESTIQFANEELHINPSSIKYTIQISSYPFTSQLNTLQLIMKASVQTTNSESCLDKQFGESIQEDADYIKLQIDKYSIYGRFIKRCQIDNSKIIKLTNTLLDSQMNDIDTNDNYQTSQSYIGINIPQFSDNIIIDPDFSVILDSNSAKTNCKRTNSSLTTSQLAGIIVGSVAFFIVLVIILGIIIYKIPGACMPIKMLVYKFKKQRPAL